LFLQTPYLLAYPAPAKVAPTIALQNLKVYPAALALVAAQFSPLALVLVALALAEVAVSVALALELTHSPYGEEGEVVIYVGVFRA
jgi:hypothetical protein